jgi:hypothetical protein
VWGNNNKYRVKRGAERERKREREGGGSDREVLRAGQETGFIIITLERNVLLARSRNSNWQREWETG